MPARIDLAHLLLSLVLGVAVIASSAAATDEMYRWVDSEGEVHYSDRPPPAGSAERIQRPGQRADGDADEQPESGVRERADRMRQERRLREHEQQVEEQRREQEAGRQAWCEETRERIEFLRTRARPRMPDEDTGEMVYLSEDQRQERIERKQRQLAEECNQ